MSSYTQPCGGGVQQFASAPLFSHRNQPSIVKRTQHKVGKVFSMQTKNHYYSSHCIRCPPPQRSPAAWFHYCRCTIV